jgi:phosphoenolpyruvate synthase/pyruvate phosphate dikinase
VEVTGTRLYINLALPDHAEQVAAAAVDGVGLLRAELLLTTALRGEHPKRLIAQGRGGEFVDRLAAAVLRIAQAFAPRPVIYRSTDFRSNEFRARRRLWGAKSRSDAVTWCGARIFSHAVDLGICCRSWSGWHADPGPVPPPGRAWSRSRIGVFACR